MIKAKLHLDTFTLSCAIQKELDDSLESDELLEHLTIEDKANLSDLFFSVVERELLKINEFDLVGQ